MSRLRFWSIVLVILTVVAPITAPRAAVAPSPSGKIRLLWAMEWADDSATWFFDSELYQK